jgi:hypothetical protein
MSQDVEFASNEVLTAVCCYCKLVKDPAGFWVAPVSHHDNEALRQTHGICPPCYVSEVQPQLDQMLNNLL